MLLARLKGHGPLVNRISKNVDFFVIEFCLLEKPGQPVKYIREGYKKRVKMFFFSIESFRVYVVNFF